MYRAPRGYFVVAPKSKSFPSLFSLFATVTTRRVFLYLSPSETVNAAVCSPPARWPAPPGPPQPRPSFRPRPRPRRRSRTPSATRRPCSPRTLLPVIRRSPSRAASRSTSPTSLWPRASWRSSGTCRTARRARGAVQDPRGECDQAAECVSFHPSAARVHCRAPGEGYDIPNYEAAKEQYANVLGSAVNPVLRRELDRRVAAPVRRTRRQTQRRWAIEPDCRSHVAHMSGGDFTSPSSR